MAGIPPKPAPSLAQRAVQGGNAIANKLAPTVAAGVAAAGIVGALSAIDKYRGPTKLNNNETIEFPEDLISTESNRLYRMSFRFEKYRRRSIFERGLFQATGETIFLPIPNNLVDSNQVSYENEGASPAVGAGIEGALKATNGNPILNESRANTIASIGGSILEGAALSTARTAAEKAGLPTDQFLQMAGFAQNPFLTVLFKSPTFKTHTFSWKLAPNNERESKKLQQIIMLFRKHMLPGMVGYSGGTLLSYPDIVQIQLHPNENYLYKFKPCVVENMTVNFAPGSTPSFFKGTDAPTEVQFSIQLKEIEYWLQEDIV